MHKLKNAACRRTTGMAAGVVLAGGLAGGVLLTPGAAYAATTNTTTTITGTNQTQTFQGTILDVHVSVSASDPGWPAGTVTVSDGSASCSAALAQEGGSSAGAGSCSLSNLSDGNYTLTASYQGWSQFSGSSTSDTVTIGDGDGNGYGNGNGPEFTADNPPLDVTNGQSYSYTFQASGESMHYALGSDAPSWLYINPTTGTVSGTAPYSGSSFSYSVVAWNGFGSVTAGPFTVNFEQNANSGANLATYLSCPSSVYIGQRGTCTLYVTDQGWNSASDVTAQIALPSQLRANSCGYYYSGCSISNNTAVENLGTLYHGQTQELTVAFTAKTGLGLWGWHHGNQFRVKVVGSADSQGGFPFYGNQSYSTAHVTIVPRGWWA